MSCDPIKPPEPRGEMKMEDAVSDLIQITYKEIVGRYDMPANGWRHKAARKMSYLMAWSMMAKNEREAWLAARNEEAKKNAG